MGIRQATGSWLSLQSNATRRGALAKWWRSGTLVLRGLPLGTFMLLSRDDEELGLRMGADARNGPLPWGWDLLDGQQRLRSLLLGVYGPDLRKGMVDKRCLWIDLDAELAPYLFKLHLTSASQPFGYDQNGFKLSPTERRTARERFETRVESEIRTNGRRAYNHELFGGFIAKKPPLDLAAGEKQMPMPPAEYPGYPDDCWPPIPARVELDRVTAPMANGRTIMPLHVLLRAWIETSQEDALASYLPPGHDRRPEFLAALQRLSKAELPLINASAVMDENLPDNLPLLYDRIGAGGTPLSNEDRLFSLYKYHQPAFHDIVLDIYENEKCGRVMVPSKIAASAIRIANALAHQRRDANSGRNARHDEGNGIPDVNQFASAIAQDAEDKNGINLRSSLDELFGIVNGVVAGDRRFSNAFVRLFGALRYDKELNPLGLPKVLLCRLPPNLIHILLFWLLQERTDAQLCNNDLMRFVMFWLLCSRNDDKTSTLCFTRIRESMAHEISLRDLFSAILEDDFRWRSSIRVKWIVYWWVISASGSG